MSINKYGLVNVLKVNYELSKNDPNFKVGLDKLLKELLWYIGERLDHNGDFKKGINRHVRQKYWSKDAVALFNSRDKDKTKDLIFEHVVPLNIIKHHIVDMFEKEATVDEIVDFLDKHLLVCVITKAEDKKLNDFGYKTKLGVELNENTIWNRYKGSSIAVCGVESIKENRNYFIKIIRESIEKSQ